MHFLRRVAIAVAVAVVGLMVATGPAWAASGNDGTSNTIQFGVVSPVLDQGAHRIVVTASTTDARLIEEEGIYPPFA